MLVLSPVAGIAQSIDLDASRQANRKENFSIGGAVGLNAVYNDPAYAGVPPVSYFLSGQLDVRVRGYSLPIAFSYSNRTFTYSQPFSFNQFSINPAYKWIRASIGTTYMTFSPYSLNGHQFQGVGLTLSPNKFTINLMYGRLLKAVQGDSITLPSYRRMGMGVKAVYNSGTYKVGVTAFQATDDASSLQFPTSIDGDITPKKNLVLGFEAGITFFKALQLNAEYNTSALTTNSQAEGENRVGHSLMGALAHGNSTTQFFNALRASIAYNIASTQTLVSLGYDRVDPSYQTLGGYYFVNDFENLTANLSQTLFKGKVLATGTIGYQHDNLKLLKSSTQKRVVGSLNINANPTPNLSLGLSYSNFSSYTNLRTVFDQIKKNSPFDQLDTLQFTQIAQNLTTNLTYLINPTPEHSRILSANVSMMQSADQQGNAVHVGNLSQFVTTTLNFTDNHPKKWLALNGGLNFNYNGIGATNQVSFGPIVGVQKGFLTNKLKTSGSVAYILTRSDTYNSTSVNLRGLVSYDINLHNRLAATIGYTGLAATETLAGRSYLSITAGYNYRF
ncbi:hypothetical protein GO730_01490 [Spirosoma sp. HMF3257]|uniref:Uncharacterized protein n=1 Tax=Spirosoma telluris TaxID=2183553 RepID=A0A327NES4_9BACT|nr:hypothetical protein [Spirosoma telluris]RAI73435.1 hypothetical protein HMF3257_01460 [Spirosoma telluris]